MASGHPNSNDSDSEIIGPLDGQMEAVSCQTPDISDQPELTEGHLEAASSQSLNKPEETKPLESHIKTVPSQGLVQLAQEEPPPPLEGQTAAAAAQNPTLQDNTEQLESYLQAAQRPGPQEPAVGQLKAVSLQQHRFIEETHDRKTVPARRPGKKIDIVRQIF